jgi:exodeoxyribonuclease VII large subunit
LQNRLSHNQHRLDAAIRLMVTLHPEAPLTRGFARVTDADGKTIMSRKIAQAAGNVMLHFADGHVAAQVGGDAAPPPKIDAKVAVQKLKPAEKPANQADLFG